MQQYIEVIYASWKSRISDLCADRILRLETSPLSIRNAGSGKHLARCLIASRGLHPLHVNCINSTCSSGPNLLCTCSHRDTLRFTRWQAFTLSSRLSAAFPQTLRLSACLKLAGNDVHIIRCSLLGALLFIIFLGGCRTHTRTHAHTTGTHRKDAEAKEKDGETDRYRDFYLDGPLRDRTVYVRTDMYACSVCVLGVCVLQR
ncbi:hypothetical protein DFP73DRAFT_299466 [Morchella snyderi]|nr:hypothetical protein DFP73DRAFT_299466 [Morchella snyderi]